MQHSAASTCRFRNEHSEVSRCEKCDQVIFQSPASKQALETTESTVFVKTGLRRSASFQHSDEAWKSMLRPMSQLSSNCRDCSSRPTVPLANPRFASFARETQRTLFMPGHFHSLPSRSKIKPWHTGRRMTPEACSLPNPTAA